MHAATKPPLACVLGEIDLLRAVALARIDAAVVAPPGAPVRYSRFAKEVIEWADPWREPRVLIERLQAFAARQCSPPVIFYDGDWDTLLLSRHREELAGSLRFVLPPAELIEDLLDKDRFRALADRLSLPVPRSVSLEDAPGELRFPVIVKPLTRQHATWQPVARAKAIRIESAADLAAQRELLGAGGVEALVQELVPGPESLIESYHVYVDPGGDVAGEFTGRKLRTYPAEYGYSTAVVITASADVAATGREICLAIGLRGVAKLDFKRGPGGELLLLEVNPRFSLWSYPGAVAGVNLPALVYADLAGLARPPARKAQVGVRWCSLPRDARAARGESIPLYRWLPWALRSEAKAALAWDDPLPAVLGMAAKLRRRAG